jgi:hypothetical protein
MAAGEPAGANDTEETPLPCRPTIACTAELVQPGRLEVEAGYARSRLSTGVQHSTPVLLKLTVMDGLQLQLGTDGYVAGPAREAYFDDLLVVAKLRLARQSGAVPELALSAGVGAPTVVRHRDAECTTAGQAVAFASKDILTVHGDLNVGVSALAMGRAILAQPFAALALSRQVGPRFTGMIEGYVFAAAAPLASTDRGLLAAVGWAATRDITLDLGGDWGGQQARRLTLFVGATLLGPRMWGPPH